MKRLTVIAALAGLGVSAYPAAAGPLEEVVPNGNAVVEGNTSNRFPILVNGGIRYQQVYNASQFGSFGGKRLITQIAFRPDDMFGAPFNINISDLEVRLSSTAVGDDGLSTIFANNVGGDVQLVYDGAINLSSADVPGPGDTRAFDIVINLQTPFSYDPTTGLNLLLDITNREAGNNNLVIGIDGAATNEDGVSRNWGPEGDPNAAKRLLTERRY